MFHSRTDKNDQNSHQNTTLRHQDLEQHHHDSCCDLVSRTFDILEISAGIAFFSGWMVSTSDLETVRKPFIFSILPGKPYIAPGLRSICVKCHDAVTICEVTIGNFIQWCQVSKNISLQLLYTTEQYIWEPVFVF